MKLLLINPPNTLFDRKYLAPPLGLLTLAGQVRKDGYEVSVLDFNLEVASNPAIESESFFEFACSMISDAGADVLAFTSMCLESHVSLELARRIKMEFPEKVMVLGGTHFGAIAADILERFDFVDYIVTGEGEDGLLAILNSLVRGGEQPLPDSVSCRDDEKRRLEARGTNRPTLDELPFPAYDLVDLERYFTLNPDRLLNYEAGRGCVFKCSFCYSPFQYGDAVRNKSSDGVVEDLRRLSALGARHIFFVQDNFLNSPSWALELSGKIAKANLSLTWECYATYPQLNDELIEALAGAGCVGIFTGIDAVTPESQMRMNKRFLKSWETTSQKLARCLEKGILPICAFILEGDSTAQRLDATINTAIECLNLGCEVHINTLSVYNNTSLAAESKHHSYSYSQIKPELLLDTPEVVQTNHFAKDVPHLFPYHSTYDNVQKWELFTTKVYVLWSVLIALRKTCYQFAISEGNSTWEALHYVNEGLVKRVRETPVTERRFEAILEFGSHIARRSLSTQTTYHLRRELARVVLSAHHTRRVVHLRINDFLADYFLGWFVPLQSHGDIENTEMLDCESDLDGSSNATEAFLELALRSPDDMIKFYAVSKEKIELLRDLSEASASNYVVDLADDIVLQLEEEGWIWAPMAPKSRACLDKGVLAA